MLAGSGKPFPQLAFFCISEVFQSFLRHWAVSQQAHATTGEWAALTPEQRDELDAGLRQLVVGGHTGKGSWLKVQIYAAIKELNGADAKSPTIDQVLRVLPEVLRKALGGKCITPFAVRAAPAERSPPRATECAPPDPAAGGRPPTLALSAPGC